MMTDAQRLERYDRLYAELLAEREKVLSEMERLRAAGRVRSATYQQLVANKLTLNNLIGRFAAHGLPGTAGGSRTACGSADEDRGE